MAVYETVYIVGPNTPEQEVGEIEDRLGKIAEKFKGKITGSKSLGQKPLSFPIGKITEGIYRHIEYYGEGTLVAELEQALKYNEKVFRFMTTRLQNKESSK